MNKLSSALLTATLVAAPMVALAAPASAGTGKVDICHATGNGKYVPLTVDKNATAGGHAGDHHQNAQDIIPAYSWVEDKVRHYFEGQNQDKWGLLATGCKADPVKGVVAPTPPVYVPASCIRPDLPYGEVVVPADLGEGIDSATTPALNPANTLWSVEYTLLPDSEDMTHEWPAGQDGKYSFDVVPITADPLWVTDSKTGVGRCELSDTGFVSDMLPYAAGALGLGLLAVGASKLRRRTN